MEAVPHSDPLEIEVTNFGPIARGKVDLRPLTVFVGPSNTGKSYLAILIYALHRCFGTGAVPGYGRFYRAHRLFGTESRRPLPPETVDALTVLAQQELTDGKTPRVGKGRSISLPGPIRDEIRSILEGQSGQLDNEISRCFGIGETKELIRRGNKNGARIVLRRPLSDGPAPGEHLLTIGKRGTTFRAAVPEDASIQIAAERDGRNIDDLRLIAEEMLSTDDEGDGRKNFYAQRLVEILAALFAVRHVLGSLRLPAFYLPADRTGVMHALGAVVNTVIEGASRAGSHPATPMLSGVLADFLRELAALNDPYHQHEKPPRDLGKEIEDAILGGSVHVNRSELAGYPRFTYRPEGWKDDLPLMNTSSMVSELAPVVLYLRHMVRTGNLLIVEEPESHLHPAMQVEFIRQLAMLVRSGVRVLVTTHSEWVLEELGNVVRRSALPEGARGEPVNAGVALRPDQVGAWLFKPKHRGGSVVSEVELDEETGLYQSDYYAVSEALYNENTSIYNRIQDGNVE